MGNVLIFPNSFLYQRLHDYEKKNKQTWFPTYLNFIPHELMMGVPPLFDSHARMVRATGHLQLHQLGHNLLRGFS